MNGKGNGYEGAMDALEYLCEVHGLTLEHFIEPTSRHTFPCGDYMLCVCTVDDRTGQVWAEAVATVAAYAQSVMANAPLLDGEEF